MNNENPQEPQIDDFSSIEISTRIVKNWSLVFNGHEINGTFTYDHDDWGLNESIVEIDEDCRENLSDEDEEWIIDYVNEMI